MNAIKNIIVGLIISFLGSLPLGYLNIIGVEVFSKLGMHSLVFYLLGVISIEAVVIYFTVIFTNQLVSNKKLMRGIDFFAIFFLLFLAYLFYSYSGSGVATQDSGYLQKYAQYSPFLIGMVLCLFNFLQIPFWVGWNLYLINANHIVLSNRLKFYYILGTLVGTFFGMLVAIVVLDSLSHNKFSFSKYILPIGIPLFFIVLSCFQAVKVYKKYIR
jgi:threonine/homoserine/homoserine lactone efflux protein